jgi:hypothetical protein
MKHDYSIFVYSFEDLEAMCGVLRMCGVETKMYSEIPSTIWDLIVKRRAVESEVKALCLLPVVDQPRHIPLVEPYFTSDIRALVKAESVSA